MHSVDGATIFDDISKNFQQIFKTQRKSLGAWLSTV